MNNDGIKDVIIGAYGVNVGGDYLGGAYIFFGRQNWGVTIDASNADVKLISENANDYFSFSVSGN